MGQLTKDVTDFAFGLVARFSNVCTSLSTQMVAALSELL